MRRRLLVATVTLLSLTLAGCLTSSVPVDPLAVPGAAGGGQDAPAIAPTLFEGFHDEAEVAPYRDRIFAGFPALTEPFLLGRSVEGRDIPGLRITAPGTPEEVAARVPVLVDGGIHGNEVYGAEAAMYLAAWLVENFGRNATATHILHEVDLHVVFLLNPDGRAADQRTNVHGVDLNRNFDIDFGNPDPLCRSQTVSPLLPYYYAGPAPLSEPETRALAGYMEWLEPRIYISHHTGRHALIRPWAACDPPHPMMPRDDAVFEAIEAWTRANTEYQNTGTAHETANRAFPPGAASGSSTDWCYLTYHCIALTPEVTEAFGEGSESTVERAEAVLPISLHLLRNARDYAAWRIPDEARAP